MESGGKPSLNKVVIAVVLFFIIGFVINTFSTYSTSQQLEQRAPIGDEILNTVRKISNTQDEMNGRLKVLEDNLKKASNSNTSTGNLNR